MRGGARRRAREAVRAIRALRGVERSSRRKSRCARLHLIGLALIWADARASRLPAQAYEWCREWAASPPQGKPPFPTAKNLHEMFQADERFQGLTLRQVRMLMLRLHALLCDLST